MFNIVILGVDNSGKTTLAENLTKLLNEVGVVKSVHSLGNVELDFQRKFMESELSPSKVIDFKIFDRFPVIEERIYGNILRGGSRYTVEDEEDFWLSKIDLFIYCDPGLKSIKNWKGRDQMDGVIDNINSLYKEYKKLYKELTSRGYNIKIYNYNTDDYRDLLEIK